MDPRQQQILQALVESQMGAPPGAPPAANPAAAAAAAAPMQPAQPPPPDPAAMRADKDTAADKAATALAPKDESKAMSADAVIYEVPFGDQTRKLTPQQIAATFERYRDLNYEHSQLKPVIELVKQKNLSAEQLAKLIEGEATMGADAGKADAKQAAKSNDPDPADDDLSKWERENAAALPPGYRKLLESTTGSTKQMEQVMQLLQQLVAGTAGVADAAKQNHAQTQQTRIEAIRRSIGVNLDRAQQQLQLPSDAANDFMTFAMERGYTVEDFVDPQLTVSVMTDFRNAMQSPEMERLRGIAQRRQAYTGTLGQGASAGGPAAGPADPQQERFTQLLGAVQNRLVT